jgi:dolichyl-phosphate-mannose-protein mannosyltransferase
MRRLPYGRWIACTIPAASAAVFAYFFPILAALPLKGPMSFTTWMWIDGWG